jgi:bifunctional DNA-binding transcriptional regulator/antitoxin component of YhaV-PrlF toxin-antitoxin module
MADPVKKHVRGPGRTRISSKHQVTIPRNAFDAAGLAEGDVLNAEAAGPGRIVLSRAEDVLDEFLGSLRTEGRFRADVDALREEWD